MKNIKKVFKTIVLGVLLFCSFSFSSYKTVSNSNISSTNNSIRRIFLQDAENFDNEDYLKDYQVIPESYSSSDNSSSGQLKYAFDNDYDTIWQSLDQGSTEIVVSFQQTFSISKIIYKSSTTNGGGEGYPKDLSLYYSTDDNEYNLIGSIKETSTDKIAARTDEKVIFAFLKPTTAKSIKLVFDNAQYDSRPRASEIKFLKSDTLVEKVENIFTDEEKKSLESYVTKSYLTGLKNEINDSLLYDYLISIIEKAEKVLEGQFTDFPVYTIQKTGNDNNRCILFLVGDGYSLSEQDDFINDCKNCINELFTYEPYAHYRNFFNVYAMKVESNDERYFDTYLTGRVAGMTTAGWKKLDALRTQMEKYYLDTGRLITGNANGVHTAVLVNSSEYGGARYPEASITFVKASYGLETFIHELSHGFAHLMDEYDTDGGHSEGINNSVYNTKDSVPWKDYWGFRGDKWGFNTVGAVGISVGSKTWYIPSDYCMMKTQGTVFCTVCEGAIAGVINSTVDDSNMPLYAFRPWIRAIKDNNYIGTLYNLNGSNTIYKLNSPSGIVNLEISTLVTNYTDNNRKVKIEFTATDKNGNTVISLNNNEFNIEPNKTETIAITSETINLDTINLASFSAKVIDLEDDSILSTDKTGYGDSYDDYGNISIKYVECDENKNYISDLNNYSSYEIPIIVGNKYKINPPILSGYTCLGSNLSVDYVSPLNNTDTIEIIYYYCPVSSSDCTHENGYEEKDIEVIVSPTCSKDGLGSVYCSICKQTITVIIPVTNIHNYSILVSPIKEATCIEEGKEAIYKCETCDLTIGGEVIEAHNHKYKKEAILPTDSSYGYTIYTCEKCSYTYRTNYIYL